MSEATIGNETETNTVTTPRPRIMSIDALRGFDMFWIIGGRETLMGVAALVFGAVPPWLQYHLDHPAWTGFSAWDMIMPLFLFLVGCVLPFSLAAEKASGKPLSKIYLRMARRVALLWVLGMIAQGNLLEVISGGDISELHLFSNTLQAIAAGYVIAGLAVLHLPLIGQQVFFVVLLVAYWAMLVFFNVPHQGAGMLDPQANVALYFDEMILGRFRDGTTYTWTLSSLGFGATVLLGVFAGEMLKAPSAPARKLFAMVVVGVGCLGAARMWDPYLPIIKHIWTSSMVLWAGGWSFLLLALFYYVVDVLEFRKWTFAFIVIGANAILAYMVGEVFWIPWSRHYFAQGMSEAGEGLVSFVALAVFWVILYVLYRKKIFLRV